jgi:hypothetical protein
MIMLWDEEFYDPRTKSFTVESYLERQRQDFGGFDAVVLWHAYPRIGFDPRNQFDFYRDVPGGLPALRDVCDRLHRQDVRVFLDYNPWDTGTRREGVSDADTLAQLVHATGADGLFLDTLSSAAELSEVMPGLVLESELELPVEHLAGHLMSWAQGFKDGAAPGVLRNKWVEARHMMHVIDRWQKDHTSELHTAWMNGTGMLVWENVFGSWNPWSPRDKSILRSMLAIQRRYADLFAAGNWTPLVPTNVAGLYASRWEYDGVTLYTLVNRHTAPVSGKLEWVAEYYDVVRGVKADRVELPARWIGCLASAADDGFLEEQRARFARASFETAAASVVIQRCREVTGSVVELDVTTRRRECGLYECFNGVGLHEREVIRRTTRVARVEIAPNEVTNAEFRAFLNATGYRPADAAGFLAHWNERAADDDPVVFVNLDDARAYARWAGQRLPTEDEWQLGMTTARRINRVWNWTDSEHTDGHTRFCIVKGGSAFQATGSVWYADGGPQPPGFSAKFILFAPGVDRCATIGFRVISDSSPRRFLP